MEEPQADCHKAGFWIRFAALWIDMLSIYLAWAASVVLLDRLGVYDHFELSAILWLIAYLAMFVGGRGRTIGKMLCGLAVRRTNGERLGRFRGLLREAIAKPIGAVFFFLGFLWVGFFRAKRGWHDYIAGTTVKQDRRIIRRARVLLALVLFANLFLVALMVLPWFLGVIALKRRNVLKPDAIDVNDLAQSDNERFVTYLRERGRPPIEYVVGKFKKHDVVILGEVHRNRETCEFVSDLIDPLYHQAGVRYFAMEFLKHKNSPLANQLVTAETYDRELALRLFRDYGEVWAFQEYMDILKAIWQVNRALPVGAQQLKVVGLDSDWDINVLRVGRPMWRIPGVILRMTARDKFMAKVLDREVLQKGQKVCVHVGGGHDFTRYRQPMVRKGELLAERSSRFGAILYEKHENRIFQIPVHPLHLGAFLEPLFAKNGNAPVGFDIEGSPLALLRDKKNYLFAHQKYAVFSDVAQGYVFLKPLEELHAVTWASGFVNEGNFERFKEFLRRRGRMEEECRTPEELDERMQKWHGQQMKLYMEKW